MQPFPVKTNRKRQVTTKILGQHLIFFSTWPLSTFTGAGSKRHTIYFTMVPGRWSGVVGRWEQSDIHKLWGVSSGLCVWGGRGVTVQCSRGGWVSGNQHIWRGEVRDQTSSSTIAWHLVLPWQETNIIQCKEQLQGFHFDKSRWEHLYSQFQQEERHQNPLGWFHRDVRTRQTAGKRNLSFCTFVQLITWHLAQNTVCLQFWQGLWHKSTESWNCQQEKRQEFTRNVCALWRAMFCTAHATQDKLPWFTGLFYRKLLPEHYSMQ